MVKLRFEVCWEGEKISYRSAGSSEAHVYSLVYLCRRSVPLPLVLWPHLEYQVGGSGSLQSEGVKRADKCNHRLLINFLLTQHRIRETLISIAERETDSEHIHAYTVLHIHFQIDDGCNISSYEYLCVQRVLQH